MNGWQERINDAAKMFQLGGDRTPREQDRIDARAAFTANLQAQLAVNIAENTDQMAKVLTVLGEIRDRLAVGSVIVQEYTFTHDGTLNVDLFDLEVPEGQWVLTRVIALATTAGGQAGSVSAGIRGLFGRNVCWCGTVIGPDTFGLDLGIPIRTRSLELVPNTAAGAGTAVTFLFVLTQVGL